MGITREEALAALQEDQDRVDTLIGRLSDEQIGRRATLGGGDWSVRDLMGHLASWEARALEVLAAWSEQRPFQVLIGVRGVDELNARNVAAWRRKPSTRVGPDAQAIHARLVAAIAELTDRDWRSTLTMSTGRRHRLSTVLGSTLGGPDGPFRHATAHLPDLQANVAEATGGAK
jgi:hypothetical protein